MASATASPTTGRRARAMTTEPADGPERPERPGGRDRGRWSDRHRGWGGPGWDGRGWDRRNWDGRGWDSRRRPFMARFGCLFAALFLFMLLGFGLTIWLLASAFGVITGGGLGAEVLAIAIVMLVF